MAWQVFVRALFITAVAWAAAILRPFDAALGPNLGIGALLGATVIFVETRLRQAEVTNLLGALNDDAPGRPALRGVGASCPSCA